MKVTFTKGPATLQRQMTDNRQFIDNPDYKEGGDEPKTIANPAYGSKLVDAGGKPVMEEIPFAEGMVLMQDGINEHQVVGRSCKAAYLYDEGKKRILIYYNTQLLVEYRWGKDTFAPEAATPEELVDTLNSKYFEIE